MGNQTVEVGEAWGGDSQVFLVNVVDSLIVDRERTAGVLEGGVIVDMNERSECSRVVWMVNAVICDRVHECGRASC